MLSPFSQGPVVFLSCMMGQNRWFEFTSNSSVLAERHQKLGSKIVSSVDQGPGLCSGQHRGAFRRLSMLPEPACFLKSTVHRTLVFLVVE